MRAHGITGLLVVSSAAFTACASGADSTVVGGMDATVGDADAAIPFTAPDVWDVPSQPDVPPPPPVCGDGVCSRPAENCMSCPLDCNQCPMCNMAPTCTGALAVPVSSMALTECNNVDASGERTNYACGADVGVAPSATTCADPQLRIRVRQMSIQQGFFDLPQNLYCAITAEDGVHAELLLTTPSRVAGNRSTTDVNLPLGQAVLWGQGDLYRSINNITITYQCFLSSDAAAAQRVLDMIAGRAGMAAQHADGYGWVFGTVAVLGTIIGSALGTVSDTNILNVQQTVAAGALLTLTNGRTWEIRHNRGNLALSGASNLTLTLESWGCAGVRNVAP